MWLWMTDCGRILKFISLNSSGTGMESNFTMRSKLTILELLRKPLGMIKLGTYENVFRCSMEATVLDVIDEMVTRNISSVPVCTTDGQFSRRLVIIADSGRCSIECLRSG